MGILQGRKQMALSEILKPGQKVWQVIAFAIVTIAVMYGKDMLDYSRDMRKIKAEKEADLEVIAAQKKADSLQEVLAGIQRAKEAEHAINAIVKTEEITDRLAIDVKALRVTVVKIHNHGVLEDGEVPDMSIYAEGTYSKQTKSLRNDWRKQPAPIGFIKHISTMLPAEGEYISPYDRYRYVPDVTLDSGVLATPVSLGILQEAGVHSVVSFWITTTKKGEIFFLNVSFGYVKPVQQNATLVRQVREAARRISRELEGI